MPILQNFIDALPAASGHVAKFSLRDVKLHGSALQPVQADALDEVQQPFCDSRLEMPKHDILDLFARLPQALAQDSEHDHAQIRSIFEQVQKIPTVQHQELAVGHRSRVRAAFFAVENRYFAEDFWGIDNIKYDFFAFVGERADLDASAQYGHQALPGRPFGKDLAAGRIAFDPGVTYQGVYFTSAQLPEQGMTFENLPFFLLCWGVHDNSLTGTIRMKRVCPTPPRTYHFDGR